ncbi:MAG: ion transporter, partial [Candidatus Omnitrophica bacterium]|nr:ion transporter [Candidatus Omnitrophota bacterium]
MVPLKGWRAKGHEIIFEADTRAGKLFDILLIGCILASVITVCLDSVRGYREAYGAFFLGLEWLFTLLFTVEYVLRILCTANPWGYVRSFFGVIDLLAILPSYLSLVFPGTQYLVVFRVFRVLRIFRVLKLVPYVSESTVLWRALIASRRKVTVFLFAVLTMVILLGALIYLIEGEENGFTSIPRSIYWAIVTLTTVGYGDLSPKTNLGQTLAAFAMILGYAIIAV